MIKGIKFFIVMFWVSLVQIPNLSAQQVQIWGAKKYAKSAIDSVYATGVGVSGSGEPETDNFSKGVTGGKAVTETLAKEVCTGSVVRKGLIPNIKPIWDVHMRDAVICLGGDGNYYLTGSTGWNIWNYNDGIELYRSKDLKRWTYLGLVWSLERDGGWEKLWREKRGKPIRAIWAPEIHYLKGNYYICLSMPPGGISILKSKTGKPEGPYIHATNPNKPLLGGIGPIPKSFLIDPTLFEDEDGKVYFTYGAANQIARMKDDLSDFAEPLREVILLNPDTVLTHHEKSCVWRNKDRGHSHCEDIGFEGATLFKRNGIYYLGSTDKYDGRYSIMLAMSKNIYGPYKMRHEPVPCNGGTGFFKAKDGYWYSCFFGDDTQAPWREKPGIIRVDFTKDGKVFIAKKQPEFILKKK